MGFASIVGAIAFIFIFLGMAAFAMHINRQAITVAQERTQAVAKDHAQTQMRISIDSLTYNVAAIVNWRDDAYSDFQGTVTNAQIVSPGTITLVGPVYSLDGTYRSQIIDSGATGTNFTTLSWTSVEPALTSASFQVRAGNTVGAVTGSSFTGPDGTASTYYTSSGSTLNESIVYGLRYIQYEATLDSNDTGQTPQVQAVDIGMLRQSGVIAVDVTNSGSEKLVLNETDIYVDGARVPRNTSARTFDLSGVTDQILWLPGQTFTINVFTTITPPQPVTVANEFATAAGTVS